MMMTVSGDNRVISPGTEVRRTKGKSERRGVVMSCGTTWARVKFADGSYRRVSPRGLAVLTPR